MPRTKKGTPPSYRRHSSGQAVVTVRLTDGSRKDILLGPWDSKRSRDEYARILGLLNGDQRLPATPAAPAPAEGLTVNELCLAYWRHVET
jgi:hypothetical protein